MPSRLAAVRVTSSSSPSLLGGVAVIRRRRGRGIKDSVHDPSVGETRHLPSRAGEDTPLPHPGEAFDDVPLQPATSTTVGGEGQQADRHHEVEKTKTSPTRLAMTTGRVSEVGASVQDQAGPAARASGE